MKFGYLCQCGWRLLRRKLTRKEYSQAKHDHAAGVDGNRDFEHQPEPCRFMAQELEQGEAARREATR